MPWQAVAVKPCNCGLLYAKVETEDGPSKRAPSKATCNNLEPWSLAKRHTTSSVTTQAKCEGVKVSLRQHKGSEMTYLPGCSLRNLPSNPLNTNLNFEMPNYVQWAGCGWQIIATKKHGFFHPKATSTVSCVPSNRCNRNFICMGISCIGIYSIYIYIRMCTYIIYPISCCWSCCCKSMVWEVSNGIVYLLAEGAEKVGIQRAIASGARSESLLPWARCLTGAYFLGSKKCKGCRPWMAMTNQTTNCKNEKIQCKTGCTKIAHSPYEEIINTWCFLNIHLDCIQKSWSGPCSA